MTRTMMIAATAALLAAPAFADAIDRIKIDAGESLFDAQCRRCQAVDATDPSYGP